MELLELQKEALLLGEEYLTIHIVHLVPLDQAHNVKVDIQLALAALKEHGVLLCERVASGAAATATAEQTSQSEDHPIGQSVYKLSAIHDDLVDEVELLGLGFLADVVLLSILLDELLHAMLVKQEAHLLHFPLKCLFSASW